MQDVIMLGWPWVAVWARANLVLAGSCVNILQKAEAAVMFVF